MKRIIALFTASAAVFALLAGSAACVSKREQNAGKPDCLRLHIIANSDSEEDQAVKLKVRDAVLDCVRTEFKASDREEAERELMLLGGRLQETAEKVLSENGMDYGAQLVAGSFYFPDRSYGEGFYPAGEYHALRIVLGEGSGENWWCVMFPPLCLIGNGEPEFNDDGTLKFKSLIRDFIREVFGV